MLELGHVFLISGLNAFPSLGLKIKVFLGLISVGFSSVSELLLVGDFGVDNVKISLVGSDSSFGLVNGVLRLGHEGLVKLDFESILSVHLGSVGVKITKKVLEKGINFSDGLSIGEILSKLKEGFGEMAPLVRDVQFSDQLLDGSLGFLNFDE